MDLLIAVGVALMYVVATVTLMIHAHRFAAARVQGRAWRAAPPLVVLLAALAIPLGDHLIGWLYFRHLCEREAGERIYRTVENVEGLRWPHAGRNTPRELGYRFIETGTDPAAVTRYTVTQDGRVDEQPGVASKSRFFADQLPGEKLGIGVWRQDFVIRDEQASNDLARSRVVGFAGGWLARTLTSGYGAYASVCPRAPFHVRAFVTSVLKPVEEKR